MMMRRAVVRRMSTEAHPKYPKTFTPLRLPVSGIELKNRVLMGSMHTGLEEKHGKNGDLDEMATFYAERARGGAGIIVTGGVAPNRAGWVLPMAGKLNQMKEAEEHQVVTKAVHDEGGVIAMQILHAGRYAYHPWAVGPSVKKAPINYFKPHALTANEIETTIADFGRCAELARKAGYDGVEIMGSEGYLINQFLAPRTNSDRRDEWGGSSFENRSRLAVRIARQVRQAAGFDDFALIFRVSLLELVENGMSFHESMELTRLLENEGVDIINSGVGWHEARIPTIATCVPRAAFSFTTAKLRKAMQAEETKLLFCATNRVNSIQVLEDLLLKESCDLVSMARPFLADPDIVNKARDGFEDDTNTCIACNQACLDHTFKLLPISCLVNPRAGHEQSLNLVPTPKPLSVAVIGGGVAGLSCAAALAECGHAVTLFEASDRLGGQFVLAANVPGKEEFSETLRYFTHRLETLKVTIKVSTPIHSPADLTSFDKLVLATGVTPRSIQLPVLASPDATTTEALPRVRSYAEVLEPGAEPCGPSVAVIGAGGIGFDVSEFLISSVDGTNLDHFLKDWGVDPSLSERGGLIPNHTIPPPERQVFLLQRKPGSFGSTLGKTTGWIRRTTLKNKNVTMLNSCTYKGIEPGALVIERSQGTLTRLPVTDIVLCAGQLSNDGLLQTLKDSGIDTFVIGGALEAKELDAKRAIDQGYRLAANVNSARPGDVFNMPTGWKAKALDFLATTFASSKGDNKKKKSKKNNAASS